MSIHPDDIRLAPENRQRLAKLADLHGKEWSELLEELLDSAEAMLGIQEGLSQLTAGDPGVPASEVHGRLRDKFDLE